MGVPHKVEGSASDEEERQGGGRRASGGWRCIFFKLVCLLSVHSLFYYWLNWAFTFHVCIICFIFQYLKVKNKSFSLNGLIKC